MISGKGWKKISHSRRLSFLVDFLRQVSEVVLIVSTAFHHPSTLAKLPKSCTSSQISIVVLLPTEGEISNSRRNYCCRVRESSYPTACLRISCKPLGAGSFLSPSWICSHLSPLPSVQSSHLLRWRQSSLNTRSTTPSCVQDTRNAVCQSKYVAYYLAAASNSWHRHTQNHHRAAVQLLPKAPPQMYISSKALTVKAD